MLRGRKRFVANTIDSILWALTIAAFLANLAVFAFFATRLIGV